MATSRQRRLLKSVCAAPPEFRRGKRPIRRANTGLSHGLCTPGTGRITPKVPRVDDESEVAVARLAQDVPVFPASPADVRDVARLVAGLSGNGSQMNAEAFVDQEPHGSAMVWIRRRRLRAG